jgi:hypothetical protein
LQIGTAAADFFISSSLQRSRQRNDFGGDGMWLCANRDSHSIIIKGYQCHGTYGFQYEVGDVDGLVKALTESANVDQGFLSEKVIVFQKKNCLLKLLRESCWLFCESVIRANNCMMLLAVSLIL